MTVSPLAMPEILSLVLAFVDGPTLPAAAAVSRAWFEAAVRARWRSLENPPQTPKFLRKLRKYDGLVRNLNIVLDNDKGFDSIVGSELIRVLKPMSSLKTLRLRFTVKACPETIAELLGIIKDRFGNQLRGLYLDIGTIPYKDAKAFFPGLVALRQLALHQCETSAVINAIARSHMPHQASLLCTGDLEGSEGDFFGSAALSALGRGVSAEFHSLSVVYNTKITSAGLIGFAEHCKTLTLLVLEGCLQIEPAGFEAIIEASPFLAHVNLGGTRVNDAALMKFTTPSSRAVHLHILMLENATRVSAIGVASIVQSCPNLYALDLRLCTEVSFAIFKEPAWKCSNLEILHMNHLGFNTAGSPSQLGDMYRQLGRLTRLLSLRFGEQRFNLRLADMGREALERLARILELELVGMIEPPSGEEIIWLVTRLKSLRYLQLDEAALESLEPAVLRDLQNINRDLEFVLLDGREFSPRK